jgi:short subunit dehydrogenase-like uncharacterized protein
LALANKQFDVIVFGATSFVGKILAAYMVETYGLDGEIKWAAAARSRSKLDDLKASLGGKAAELPLIIADAGDEAALQAMVSQTKVIISTVGPYALYGEPLVRVCAETGTHYCDLTGEAQWSRQMGDKYRETAEKSGARIVHSCGFDSIPSDLGVHILQKEAQAKHGAPCTTVKMGVKAIKGGMSGGTAASLLNAVKEASKDPALRRIMADPYNLCGPNHGFTARQRNVSFAEYDKDFGRWLAPFIMAAINTRVVHQSNALSGKAYGENFKYDESVFTKGRMPATLASLGLGAFMAMCATRPTRAIVEKFMVPSPGEGPTPEQQLNGFYDLRFWGKTDTGDIVKAKVTGDRDPGYGSTAKMLAQAGIALAHDKAKTKGGFWTPATAFGDQLVDRLTKNAGLTFEIV